MTTSHHQQRRLRGVGFALLGTILILLFVRAPMTTTRSVVCGSGRTKYEIRVMGLCIDQQIEETAFSQIVAGRPARDREPEWKPYFSRSPWQPVSPHYRFHSVPNDLNALVEWLRTQQRNEEDLQTRCLAALEFLNADDVKGLDDYCQSL